MSSHLQTSPLRLLLLSSLLLLSACASSGGATQGVDVKGPRVAASGKPGQPEVQINARAKLLFEDAVKAFDAQKKARAFNYPQLRSKFEAALAADGRLAEAHYNLGVIAEREGNRNEAVAQYREALRKKPTLRQAAENLAVMAQNSGDTQAAANTYQQILENYPDDASSRARLAEIARQQGDTDRALELSRQALMREPRALGAYKVMMSSYLDRKQLAMAKLVALRATKIDESDPELYHTIGLVLLAEGEATKARAQFQKAVEVRADYQPAHVQLAKMAMASEDYSGAEEHLRAILRTGGKSAEVFVNLGVAYKGMGQYDKAMQAYDEAEKLNPELAPIFLNRGIILHRHKNAPDRGLQLYEKYLALSGGEVGQGGDSVYKLIDEARGVLAQREEERRAVEEAARMEKEMKEQERVQQELEKRQKQESELEKRREARGNAAGEAMGEADPATGKSSGETQPAAAPSNNKKKGAPAPAPAPAPKSAPAQAPEPSGDELSDEPSDSM